jgi:hypothetical protein
MILTTLLFVIVTGCLVVYIEDRRIHQDMAALYQEEGDSRARLDHG